MADAKVSKTFDPKDHVGSTPSLGTESDSVAKFDLAPSDRLTRSVQPMQLL